MQKLVEDLRPLMLKTCGATDSELVGLRPEFINRLQAVGVQCRLAKEASDSLTKVAAQSVKGVSASQAPQTTSATDSRALDSSVQHQAGQTSTVRAPQESSKPQQAPVRTSAAGQSTDPHADAEVPRFPFSIVKPRPAAHTQHAKSEAAQPHKAQGELPIGAVALSASQAAPLATLPSANAVNAHAQAEFKPSIAQNASAPQLSTAQQQTVETSSSSQPTDRQPADFHHTSAQRHQTVVPHSDDSSGLQSALPTVKRDQDNAGHSGKARTGTSPPPSPPAPQVAAHKDSVALMSMLSSGKRLHEAVCQESNDPAQHKDHTESTSDPMPKKPKLVPGQ